MRLQTNFDLLASVLRHLPAQSASFPFLCGSIGLHLMKQYVRTARTPLPNRIRIITALHGSAQQFDRGWPQPRVPAGPRRTEIHGTGSECTSIVFGTPTSFCRCNGRRSLFAIRQRQMLLRTRRRTVAVCLCLQRPLATAWPRCKHTDDRKVLPSHERQARGGVLQSRCIQGSEGAENEHPAGGRECVDGWIEGCSVGLVRAL